MDLKSKKFQFAPTWLHSTRKSGFVCLYEYCSIGRAIRKSQKSKIKKWISEFIKCHDDYYLPQLWRTGL